MDDASRNVKKLTNRQEPAFPVWQGVSRRDFLGLVSGLAVTGLFGSGNARLRLASLGTLQYPQDPSQPTAFERLHLPLLKLPYSTRNGAHVPLVVEMSHPMEPDHYIKSIQILNESDPIPSKGTFSLTPANGQAYLAIQARMHSGNSSVLAISECNLHGQWAQRQPILIPEGAGGCTTASEKTENQSISNDEIRPPVIRIPELVSGHQIQRGEVIQVQVKFKHPNRTGLALREGKFVQEAAPFYIREMQVFYGEHLLSRYDMTPAVSDNPFLTFKLRATEARP